MPYLDLGDCNAEVGQITVNVTLEAVAEREQPQGFTHIYWYIGDKLCALVQHVPTSEQGFLCQCSTCLGRVDLVFFDTEVMQHVLLWRRPCCRKRSTGRPVRTSCTSPRAPMYVYTVDIYIYSALVTSYFCIHPIFVFFLYPYTYIFIQT